MQCQFKATEPTSRKAMHYTSALGVTGSEEWILQRQRSYTITYCHLSSTRPTKQYQPVGLSLPSFTLRTHQDAIARSPRYIELRYIHTADPVPTRYASLCSQSLRRQQQTNVRKQAFQNHNSFNLIARQPMPATQAPPEHRSVAAQACPLRSVMTRRPRCRLWTRRRLHLVSYPL